MYVGGGRGRKPKGWIRVWLNAIGSYRINDQNKSALTIVKSTIQDFIPFIRFYL